jgi:hypothetical protein
MGRTVPSFRIVLTEEKQEWTPFKKALDKSERKEFDEMWDIPKLYVSVCSNSVQEELNEKDGIIVRWSLGRELNPRPLPLSDSSSEPNLTKVTLYQAELPRQLNEQSNQLTL